MRGEQGFSRFFACMSLFIFSMLGIVLSNNFIQIFIFWELVGLSSYLLIGYYFEKTSASDAAKKAFLVNRVGDFGFILGIFVIFQATGTFNFIEINHALEKGAIPDSTIYIAALLIFCGTVGKSAQFPLHVWLTDAMEGPTPVSALIHAATMVAAGVYLLARMFSLFLLSPVALEIIAYIGGFTALFAATQAIVQKDIKRVLAYSTLSKLGYMVMAIGLGSAAVGMYHLTTHAFFKALLFLGAGSIIHATEKQNIFEMGGVIKKMPFTSAAFLIGTFALIGFWPSSGFFSKDKILALAFSENRLLFISSAITVFLTALYMGRAISLMFFGASKIRKKLHEPSQKILMPLLILSILSLSGGFFGFERFLHDPNHHEMSGPNSLVIQLATVLGLAGVFSGFFFYRIGEKNRKSLLQPFSWAYEILMRKYFMDDLYDFLIRYIQQPFAKLLDWFERTIIVEGAVNHAASFTALTGRYFKKLQTGRIQTYLSVFFSGVVIAIYLIRFGALH